MPQLDKYIFFNHVISLTIFFGLIYIFIRKSVIPELSTVFKFRWKKLKSLSTQATKSEKIFLLHKFIFQREGKKIMNKIAKKGEKLIFLYNLTGFEKLLIIYEKNYSLLKKTTSAAQLMYYNTEDFYKLRSNY